MHRPSSFSRLTSILLISGSIAFAMSCQKSVPGEGGTVNQPKLPQLKSVFPSKAKAGDTLTAKGSNLPTDRNAIHFYVNKMEAPIILATPDSIQAVVPKLAGSGVVSITVGNGEYRGPAVTYDYTVTVSTLTGTGVAGAFDGDPSIAMFNCPWGLANDLNGDLLVAESYGRVIRRVRLSDGFATSITIPITPGGQNFFSPNDIAVDPVSGSWFLTDFNKHILRRDPDGTMNVIYQDSMAMSGIVVSPDGKNLYISNNTTGAILKMDLNGQNAKQIASLLTPRNMVFDTSGHLFVAAYPGPVYDVSATPGPLQIFTSFPDFQGWEFAILKNGDIVLADHFANKIFLWQRGTNAVITLAGNGVAADIDGPGLQASFNGPQGIVVGSDGNIYVSTYNYDTKGGNKIRRIMLQ